MARHLLVASLVAPIAIAAPAGAAARFDEPVSTARVAAGEGAEFVCSNYGDLLVVQKLDGPSSTNAVLVSTAGARCGPVAEGAGKEIPTEGFELLGRAGPVLVFSAMDANGAADLLVVRAADGKVLSHEATMGTDPIGSVEVRRDGSVILTYRRGINAPCSLMQNASGCWAQVVRENAIPAAMAARAPTAKLCGPSYKAQKAPVDDPSIVSWPQETTIDAESVVTWRALGAVACAPMP